jgi:hypothetical protein
MVTWARMSIMALTWGPGFSALLAGLRLIMSSCALNVPSGSLTLKRQPACPASRGQPDWKTAGRVLLACSGPAQRRCRVARMSP